MPQIPTSDVQVAQAACVDAGFQPISSFTDDTDEAKLLNRNYETVVQTALTMKPWPFCRRTKVLARDATEPDDKWSAIYSMPTNPSPIRVRTVRVADAPIDYEIRENKILCDASENDVVVMDYSYRVAVPYWPANFTLYVQTLLAARLSASLKNSDTQAKSLTVLADSLEGKIGNIHAQSETAKRMPLGRMMAVRRGAWS